MFDGNKHNLQDEQVAPRKNRGPGRAKKKLLRAQQHRLAQGLDIYEPGQLRQEGTELSTGFTGTLAESVHRNIMNEKKNEPLPEGDEKKGH